MAQYSVPRSSGYSCSKYREWTLAPRTFRPAVMVQGEPSCAISVSDPVTGIHSEFLGRWLPDSLSAADLPVSALLRGPLQSELERVKKRS